MHLNLDIAALAERYATAPRAVGALVKPAFVEARRALFRKFEEKPNAAALLQAHSRLVDQVIIALWQALPARPEKLAVIAVGGYGRRELFPFSDIDLLFLHDGVKPAALSSAVEGLLYGLWDLGLVVGQATRSVDEALRLAREDFTVRTNMLDARPIVDDAALSALFDERFHREVMQGTVAEFIDAKLAERDQRHQRAGDSRYSLEPNVKDGKGGLRDMHTIAWLARYAYPITRVEELVALGVFTGAEVRDYARAERFLWNVRTHLHLVAGKAEERLTFDRQRSLAERMGFRGATTNIAIERLMKRYFLAARTVGQLTRLLLASLEEEHKRRPRLMLAARERMQDIDGFVLEGERLNVKDEADFSQEPWRVIGLFHTAQRHGLDIHPRALKALARALPEIGRQWGRAWLQDAKSNALFLELLCSDQHPETALRRMSEAGVLSRFLPDFGRVIGQMQFDMYHHFTVDEHTLFAIGNLAAIARGSEREELPLATDILPTVTSKRVLYLALLCHDIAKGRGGDHSELGEKIARQLAKRFGFTANEAENTAWLVRHHLLMTHTAFKRDVHDPDTIREFVAAVQSPERLRLLLVLTVADIRAVGPNVWNGWKGALLRDLFTRAETLMGTGQLPTPEAEAERFTRALSEAWPGADPRFIERYVVLGHPAFWQAVPVEAHVRLARRLQEVETQEVPLVVEHSIHHFHAVTELTVITPDQPGLFSKLAGAMALVGANIVHAKIFTLKNGIAVDFFGIQEVDAHAQGKAYGSPEKLAKLAVKLQHAVSGGLEFEKEFAARKRSYPSRFDSVKVPSAVFIDNHASSECTVIEVNGRDRLGFLYDVTRALAALRLSVTTAHISTYGVRAVDVFYIKDQFGMKVTSEAKLAQIREALHLALTPKEVKLAS